TVGPSSGYPFFAGGIISTAKTLGWGRLHKGAMRQIFGHVQFVGMIGQDPPVASSRVDLDPAVEDIYGKPAARVTYSHHPNLYLTDASVFPTSGGYNPTLTIQALAWRAAERMIAEHFAP